MINPRIIMMFRAACIAADRGSPETTALADQFFDAIAAIPVTDAENRALAIETFNAVISQVELLPANRAFEPTMIAADALAACLLRSPDYAGIARGWAEREHAAPRTGAMRTYAKVTEYDPSRIDGEVLYTLARRLDQMTELTRADEGTQGYLGLVAGKLRADAKGIRLIEQLASQRPPSRVIAAHAIAYDIALDPPSSSLSVFAQLGPSSLRSDPPHRRLVWLFISLCNDSDPTVVNAAEIATQQMRHSWPEFWNNLINLRNTSIAPTQNVSPPESQIEYPPVTDAKSAVELALADLRSRTGRAWTRAELAGLRHGHLARPLNSAAQPKGIDVALRFPGQSNKRQGVLTWSTELFEQDIQAEAAGEAPPVIIGAPRLFISYRWSNEIGEVGLLDFLAGRLFGAGYDIVFDRDPRHLAKGLSAGDVLLLLHGCSHFLPIITEEMLELLSHAQPGAKSPLEIEWELARQRSRAKNPLHWLTIWCSGERLPRQLATKPVVDLRDLSKGWAAFDRAFPSCRFEVHSIGRNGAVHRSAPVNRLKLREAIKKARARRGCVDVEIYDVTKRDSQMGFAPLSRHVTKSGR